LRALAFSYSEIEFESEFLEKAKGTK